MKNTLEGFLKHRPPEFLIPLVWVSWAWEFAPLTGSDDADAAMSGNYSLRAVTLGLYGPGWKYLLQGVHFRAFQMLGTICHRAEDKDPNSQQHWALICDLQQILTYSWRNPSGLFLWFLLLSPPLSLHLSLFLSVSGPPCLCIVLLPRLFLCAYVNGYLDACAYLCPSLIVPNLFPSVHCNRKLYLHLQFVVTIQLSFMTHILNFEAGKWDILYLSLRI